MVQTVKKIRTNFKTGQATGAGKIDRYKIGKAPPQDFTPKETAPGVMSIAMPKVTPSRPQLKERMGVGGRKGKAKGRTDPKAADPKDPGQVKFASTKVHWPTNDAKAKKGYVVGKAWPDKGKTLGGIADGLQEGITADGPY